MQPTDHLDDEVLSTLVDDQLTPAEAATAQSHLGMCDVCQARIDEFRSVALLLRSLPDLDPPRDFALGPREVADPPNVIRLQRWYAATRVAAASLAAVFVVLSAGTLYVDSRPPSGRTAEVAPSQLASAPAAADANNGAAAGAAAAPRPATSPVAAVAPAPPAAPAAARSVPTTPQADDQVAAATSSRPLPTPLPTATVALPPPAARIAQATADALDPAAPLRTAAFVVGLLAVLTLLATLVIRHRLRLRTSHL